MSAPRETIMAALFNKLVGSIATSFLANTTLGSPVLTGSSALSPAGAQLFLGMPIGSGSLFPPSTFIAGLSPLTLSENALATQSGATFETGFRTTGRRLVMWTKVTEQPALFLRNIADEYPRRHMREIPSVPTLECEAWVYSDAGSDPDLPPGIVLNNLVDAVSAALDPVPGEAQTLGLSPVFVQHCWIEGRIDFHPGDLDGQAIAVIPIRILAPGF